MYLAPAHCSDWTVKAILWKIQFHVHAFHDPRCADCWPEYNLTIVTRNVFFSLKISPDPHCWLWLAWIWPYYYNRLSHCNLLTEPLSRQCWANNTDNTGVASTILKYCSLYWPYWDIRSRLYQQKWQYLQDNTTPTITVTFAFVDRASPML